MNYPIPIFLFVFIIIFLLLSSFRKREERTQQELNEAFLERERQANLTRKQDISNLNYVTLSLDHIPAPASKDPLLLEHYGKLCNLSSTKLLNLSRITNTDLKLQYGVANLTELSEYDENYQQALETILAYGKRLMELNCDEAATELFEYAASLQFDSSIIYTSLYELYDKTHSDKGSSDILAYLSSMSADDAFYQYVSKKLEAFHTPQ